MADSLGKEKREEEQGELLGVTSFQTFSPLEIRERNKTNTSFDSLPMECEVQFTTSSRRLDGGAYCGAPVGGKCMVSKAKLVLYAFAV